MLFCSSFYIQIAKVLQIVLNFALLILATILLCFMGKELYVLFQLFLFDSEKPQTYQLIEGIIVYFLYFELIGLIIKYFLSDNHFPLRYFIYIGITAIVRLIVVDHHNPFFLLIYSLTILILVYALYFANKEKIQRGLDKGSNTVIR